MIPGTSCLATISLSLRDKSHSPIEVPHNYLSAYRVNPGLNGAKLSEIWGSLLPGGATGNRPPGRRALKGRQVIVISNRLEKHIFIGPAIVQLCAGAHY